MEIFKVEEGQTGSVVREGLNRNADAFAEATDAVNNMAGDVASEDGALIILDRMYDPAGFSGLGEIILRKNISAGKNILTQDMISFPNTRYIIRYDFNLNAQKITMPENCVLVFEGGSFDNGVLLGTNTRIEAASYQIFGDNLALFEYYWPTQYSSSITENRIIPYYVDEDGILHPDRINCTGMNTRTGSTESNKRFRTHILVLDGDEDHYVHNWNNCFVDVLENSWKYKVGQFVILDYPEGEGQVMRMTYDPTKGNAQTFWISTTSTLNNQKNLYARVDADGNYKIPGFDTWAWFDENYNYLPKDTVIPWSQIESGNLKCVYLNRNQVNTDTSKFDGIFKLSWFGLETRKKSEVAIGDYGRDCSLNLFKAFNTQCGIKNDLNGLVHINETIYAYIPKTLELGDAFSADTFSIGFYFTTLNKPSLIIRSPRVVVNGATWIATYNPDHTAYMVKIDCNYANMGVVFNTTLQGRGTQNSRYTSNGYLIDTVNKYYSGYASSVVFSGRTRYCIFGIHVPKVVYDDIYSKSSLKPWITSNHVKDFYAWGFFEAIRSYHGFQSINMTAQATNCIPAEEWYNYRNMQIFHGSCTIDVYFWDLGSKEPTLTPGTLLRPGRRARLNSGCILVGRTLWHDAYQMDLDKATHNYLDTGCFATVGNKWTATFNYLRHDNILSSIQNQLDSITCRVYNNPDNLPLEHLTPSDEAGFELATEITQHLDYPLQKKGNLNLTIPIGETHQFAEYIIRSDTFPIAYALDEFQIFMYNTDELGFDMFKVLLQAKPTNTSPNPKIYLHSKNERRRAAFTRITTTASTNRSSHLIIIRFCYPGRTGDFTLTELSATGRDGNIPYLELHGGSLYGDVRQKRPGKYFMDNLDNPAPYMGKVTSGTQTIEQMNAVAANLSNNHLVRDITTGRIFSVLGGVLKNLDGTNAQRYSIGTTAKRAVHGVDNISIGTSYYDTTLKKQLWSTGTEWQDSAGTSYGL